MKRTQLEKKIEESGLKSNARKNMFHYLFQVKDSDTGNSAYSADELNAKVNLLIIVGSETTLVILSAFLFYVSRDSKVYVRLSTKIRTTFKSVEDILEETTLSSCEYLRACIQKIMRMSSAKSSELVRKVLS